MIDDPLTLLSLVVWLMAAGMYPLGFLFGACSPCCQRDDACQWLLNFDRCISVGVAGSSPPDGGDVRVSLSRAGSGDVEYMTGDLLQIHHVQSEIRITMQIQIGAAGSSRTPVGDTRTQVWRLNRAAPTTPAATVYDVLGPPWHLQIDLSVTGVATAEEAGVSTSIGTDEHGQPKLVVQVNQWTQQITHTVDVTLYPTGLQRWGPGLAGTQSRRLTTSGVLATRVEGDAYSGWSVGKLAGLTIVGREPAIRVVQFTLPFNLGITVERIFLDGTTAINFVANSASITVPATVSSVTTNRELTVQPDNVLCQLPKDLGIVGIPLGVYPEYMTLTVPESFRNAHPQNIVPSTGALWCGPDTLTMRPDLSSCVTTWRPSYSRKGATVSAPIVGVSAFYPGRSLLWNLVQGPYRESLLTTGPVASLAQAISPPSDWLVTLGGSGAYSLYDTPEGPCPSGTSTLKWTNESGFTVAAGLPDFNACTPVAGSRETREFAFVASVNWEVLWPEVDEILIVDDAFAGYTLKTTTYSGTLEIECYRAFTTFADGKAQIHFGGSASASFGGPYVVPAFDFTGDSGDIPRDRLFYVRGDGGTVGRRIEAVGEVGCSESGDMNLSISVLPVGLLTNISADFQICGVSLTTPSNPFPVDCQPDQVVEVTPSYSLAGSPSMSYTSRRRTVCSDWSPSTIPSLGGTVTRTCGDQYDGDPPTSPTLSLTFGESRTRLPRLVNQQTYQGSDNILRNGNCRLLTLTAHGFTTTAGTTFISAVADACYYLKPSFGSGFTSAGTGDIAEQLCQSTILANSLPCEGCDLSVSVVSGAENARVRYVASGIKRGTIEVVALRTWLSGEGVTISVSCGGDTITHIIRRA